MSRKMNPVCLKFLQALFMVCLVLQVVCEKEAIRCLQSERDALLHLKAGFVDPHGMLSSWSTTDCCQWKGIRCSNFTGHVLKLDLHGQITYYDYYGILQQSYYISGMIHKSLMELKQLKYLNLSSNFFEGNVIPDFFGSLSNLRYLDLSDSEFHGRIPSQFGSLSHLMHLDLGGNYLEGSIPSQLGNLSNLQYLDLTGNFLTGDIPSQLGNLSNLQYLDLTHNSLTGDIPSQLGNLSNLQYLDLTHNSLTGDIPSQLGNLSNLQYLDLTENFLTGDIPSQLGNLSNLQYLDLTYNSLTGDIPSQLGKLSNLQKLYLGGYDSNLKIDDGGQWLSNLTSLTHLLLCSIPNLNGSDSWLQMIGKLSKLKELSLSDCSLSDHFILSLSPLKFSSSTSLSVLDLSGNTFTSSIIFQWVSNISSNLVELDLSFNKFLEASPSNYFANEMIGKLPKLRELWLFDCNLSDNFILSQSTASKINSSASLSILGLSSNTFTSSMIFQWVSNITSNLVELDMSFNQITGSLPDLSIFSSLKTLELSGNRLSGKISEVPSQLESLSIGSNSLEGGIPKSFGNACKLHSLVLSNNSLSEELPVIMHHLSGCARYSLKNIDLSMNQINGTLPNFSIFLSLRILDLSQNRLSGMVSEDTRFPTQLERLAMNSNFLKGVISDSHFANMSWLETLELSDNSLALTFTQNWVPSFQLREIRLRSCKLGPAFPKWLQTQNDFDHLDISNAEISDVVPKWFWVKLASQEWMSSMNISYNNLKGIIPNYPLKNAYFSLVFASNEFEGPIPPFLRGSILLDLSKNNFSESLSFFCANGTVDALYQLDLSNNQLSGQIPDCWSKFKSLVYLDLSHNNFSGKIPASMGLLLELQALLLRNNSLIEEIPPSLGSCTNLVMLDVGENRLSGSIPSWFGSKLLKLKVLSLGKNHLSGSLPLQLCYLKNIQLLDLSLNNLFGRIPKCFKNFTLMAQKTSSRDDSGHWYFANTSYTNATYSYDLNAFLMWKGVEQMFTNNELLLLKSIDLSSNHFSEDIPAEIENLVELVSLNLSRNNLTGEIPSNIGKLTSLEFLDLSRNQLFGSIPSSLAQIDRLTMLDLSHNNLSGEIPTSTQLQSFNASSYEDNLDLCGPPLEKMCIEGNLPQEPKVKFHGDEDLFFSHGFYFSMAFGFVIGFWGIFGSIIVKRSWRHAYFKFLNNLTDSIYVMVTVTFAKYKRWFRD